VLKIGTTFLTAALRKTEATPRSSATITGERMCFQSYHVCVKLTEWADTSFMFQSIRITDSLIWQYLLNGGL
jgi:hypothetical protein